MPNAWYVGLKKTYQVKLEKEPQLVNELKAAVVAIGGIAEFVNRDGLYILLPAGRELADAWLALNEEGVRVRQFFNKRATSWSEPKKVSDIYNDLQGGRYREGAVLLDIFEGSPVLFGVVGHPRIYAETQLVRVEGRPTAKIHLVDNSVSEMSSYFGTAKKGIRYPILGGYPADLFKAFKQNPLFFNEWVHQCFEEGHYVNLMKIHPDIPARTWSQYKDIFFSNGEGAAVLDVLRGPQFQNVSPASLRGIFCPAIAWTF